MRTARRVRGEVERSERARREERIYINRFGVGWVVFFLLDIAPIATTAIIKAEKTPE